MTVVPALLGSPQLRLRLQWAAVLPIGIAVAWLVATRGLAVEVPLPVVVLGVIVGLTYGLLAVGLVLVYRANRIINFAHGEIGVFAAAIFGLAYFKSGLNYYLLLPLGLAAGALAGVVSEFAVVRRLRSAPRLMSVVATLGVGQFLVLFGSAINSRSGTGTFFPSPPGFGAFHVGALRVTPAYTAILIVSPILVAAIWAFLRFSRFGLAIRSSADNPEAARMAAIPAARMSTLAWGIAGFLSAYTVILTQPTRGFVSVDSFGPQLMLRALTAAVLARMNSLPIAMAGGIGLGVVEQVLLWNYPQSGLVEVSLFAVIVVTLLLQRQQSGRDEPKGSWAAVEALRPLPPTASEIFAVRHLGKLVAIVGLGAAALVGLLLGDSTVITLYVIVALGIVGVSVVLVTGMGGQLSLGQFAVAACGAWASYEVVHRTGNIALGFAYAAVAGAAVCVVLGLPSLRVKGLFFTVTTLSFAIAAPAWMFQQPFFFGSGVNPPAPEAAGIRVDTPKSYYLFALGVLALLLWLANNVRRGGLGRLLVAVRDNEDTARAFTVAPTRIKVIGFAFAGVFAGLGGALYAHGLSSIASDSFPTSLSIDVVTMTVIGGVSLLAGPLLGAAFVIGIPRFVPLDSAGLAATKFGLLLILLYLPQGLGGLVAPGRERLVRWITHRRFPGLAVDFNATPTASGSAIGGHVGAVSLGSLPRARYDAPAAPGPLLRVDHIGKAFGGVHAVRDVSFEMLPGETVGLIGPNGAGKTTTFEIISGFTTPDTGRVLFRGEDLDGLRPEQRGRLGLIRSFQDAALFPTLTVQETVETALERVSPTAVAMSVLGRTRRERERSTVARDLLAFMGLEHYAASCVRELSTGTRRIAEITCLVALQPTLLLLDEPSSGVAQRETEALGQLLEAIRKEFSLTLLVIEHDIPLVMGLADRIIVMADGEVLASGPPSLVRSDPKVVEAYLGGSRVAIERSRPTGTGGGRKRRAADVG